MNENIEVFHAIAGKLDRKGRGPAVVEPPLPPTNLTAEPGDTTVSLSWTPSTSPNVVSYKVYRVNANLLVSTTPASPAVITGLTNEVTYNFHVLAVDNTGQVSAPSNVATATPTDGPEKPNPLSYTVYGFNTADDAPLSERLAKLQNRAPCVRRYSGAGWNMGNGVFPFTTAIAPEKRVCYSTKANDTGTFSKNGIASGAGNSQIRDWCEDIPAGWYVSLVYYHEPNDNIRDGSLTISQYRNGYEQFRTAIDSAQLQTGVRIFLDSNFMAYRVADRPAYFDDSWVPPVGVADRMTFDLYGNPGHFTSGVKTTTGTNMVPNCSLSEGLEYTTGFPNVTTRWKDTLEAIVRNGFARHWGILEFNSPPRDWDGPVNPQYVCSTNKRLRYQGGRNASGFDTSNTEVARAAWFKNNLTYVTGNPTILGETLLPPEIFLFWEHPEGVNWNQSFYNDRMWNTIKPYITGTPLGGV